MTITLKNVRVKYDKELGRDKQVQIDVEGKNFKDIQDQISEFAQDYAAYKGYDFKEVDFEQNSITDLGRFKVENPNEEQQ